VRAALAMSDYHNFFKLYKQTPNMGAYIIDLFIEKMRITALKTICKAYASASLSLSLVLSPQLCADVFVALASSCRDATQRNTARAGTDQRSM
jgi:hypothetical protein